MLKMKKCLCKCMRLAKKGKATRDPYKLLLPLIVSNDNVKASAYGLALDEEGIFGESPIMDSLLPGNPLISKRSARRIFV